MDFVEVDTVADTKRQSDADFNVRPELLYGGIKDLVVRGGAFYAYWSGERWSTNIDDLIASIDHETYKVWKDASESDKDHKYVGKYIRRDGTGLRSKLQQYLKQSPNSDAKFNTHILFSDDKLTRDDYATAQLSYTPKEGESPNFDKLFNLLYEPEELNKILWFIGAALTNSMKDIQKFMYLYGGKGTGKGTVIDLFKMLFQGYYAEISLATLTGGSEFATAQVQEVPILVDSDSDMSKIKQDTNLLKLTAHEPLLVNKKFQSQYEVQFDGLLITASNQRYQVRNVDAGINRRAIVVEPSNNTFEFGEYRKLKAQLKFELPEIAYKAIKVFNDQGPARYENLVNLDMMTATDPIFEFVHENWELFGDPATLKQIAEMYKVYLEDLGWDTRGYKRVIKNEMMRYFKHYQEKQWVDGVRMRNVYSGFKQELVVLPGDEVTDLPEIALDGSESAFDAIGADWPAQYANDAGTPEKSWDNVTTTLKDIDTTKLHYVRVPYNHIVIDLDLRDENGDKSLKKNLQKATEYPPTYAELSKSGNGVHLHYLYKGNPEELDPLQAPGIECKVYVGKSSLRRKRQRYNSETVSELEPGTLKLKEEEVKVYDDSKEMLWTEKKIRTAIEKNLRKEYHPATKPSMDFIKKILDDAVREGITFDVRDLRQPVLVFAMRSTHQRDYCVKLVKQMTFSNGLEETQNHEDIPENKPNMTSFPDDNQLYFFDIEVYPNLFVVCYKQKGEDKVHSMVNPTADQIEELTSHPLIGFNNKRYDNHILYGRLIGRSIYELFQQSSTIINGQNRRDGMFGNAYNLAYTDIYDYNSKKKSLKMWEVKLGLLHDEMEIPWDKPVPNELWPRVVEYCSHDVNATEALFNDTYEDYVARKILCELTGLPASSSTQDLAAKFIFGDDPKPQDKLVYTDLSTIFPGYKFEMGRSSYMGEDPSEGGYVYSEPGVYKDVAEVDIASMHPSSAIALNYFGEYTQRFADLKQARVYVKHHDFEHAGEMLGGALKPYLTEDGYKGLAYALKIIINIVYGMSSAKYVNKFRSKENNDNIIAKRGALFMITLKHAVQAKGWQVAHIKTDAIKLPDITQEKIDFVVDFGKKYGYDFEVEHIFDRFALVNKAVNVGHVEDNPAWGSESNTWQAIGAQFIEPYVFKKLFSHEKIEDVDFAKTFQAKLPIYVGDQFVGKVCQAYASVSGSPMVKKNDEGKEYAVTGTKGTDWKLFSKYDGLKDVDISYYDDLCKDAIHSIDKVGQASELFDDTFLQSEYYKELLPF